MRNRRIVAATEQGGYQPILSRFPRAISRCRMCGLHGDTQTIPGHVVAAIINKTKELWEQPKQGCTMFISHAAMLHLPEAFRRGFR
jgi:hypothetical protein